MLFQGEERRPVSLLDRGHRAAQLSSEVRAGRSEHGGGEEGSRAAEKDLGEEHVQVVVGAELSESDRLFSE